jgi:protein-disulfide isomerase
LRGLFIIKLIFKNMIKKYILFTLLGAAVALIFVWGIDKIREDKDTASAPAAEQRKQGGSNAPLSIEGDDPFLGSADAPITIVEFSDFQCPFCANFYLQTFPKIKQDYIDTGKVKFVYRDFPLNFHQYAQKSAEASECADEQGKFWEYKDILFTRQAEWSTGGIPKLKEYASMLSLDQESFDSCLDSGSMSEEVESDFADGRSLGVTGTPAFFINGELVSGAQPFSVFKQKIDSLL